ncbi:hypothetical protein OIV83_001947 [Microbotryomycetes sp. JL201]|nr:hypothetical protein OIV83_001947 [Microbotryomycetes sp. JL201]
MAARKIPINTGAGQRQPPPSQTAWASSLDLVFSFSRSAAFFGDNLPSGPSFVDTQRYRRPGDDGESSIAPSDERDGDTSDDHWSADESDDHQHSSWDTAASAGMREQLPANAVQRSRRALAQRSRPPSHSAPSSLGSNSANMSPPANESLHRPYLAAQADERTPLVRPRELPPSPRSKPLSNKSAQYRARSPHSSSVRRLSIISSEAWQAAIEENRGMSTWGQTLFNTVNVLIGVGLLAEPFAFAEAGWVLGTILLLFCALITNYTGKMLAKIMTRDDTLTTYADVLIKAYGNWSRSLIYAMFVIELGALSIALVTLFADSMESLFPRIPVTTFKIMFFFIIVPTTFVPLRFLSISSLIGIISTFMLLVVLVTDGALMPTQPGSLRDAMPTHVGPQFGQHVSSEVTRDLIHRPGNPVVLNKIAVWMVALNPVVKYAVANAPLVQTFEIMVGIQKTPLAPAERAAASLNGSAINSRISESSAVSSYVPLVEQNRDTDSTWRRYSFLITRPFLTGMAVILAIVIPDFERVLAFLGSASAFIICCIGPIGAYLIISRNPDGPRQAKADAHADAERARRLHLGSSATLPPLRISRAERFLCWTLLIVSIVLASVGTVWAFLPLN